MSSPIRRSSKKTTFAYVARLKGEVVGTAFFDSHIVRSKRETLMVAVNPDGVLRCVDTVAFAEPRSTSPRTPSTTRSQGERGRPLTLGRGLDGTTGATLTCRAVANACRRALALRRVGAKVGRGKKESREGSEGRPLTCPPDE